MALRVADYFAGLGGSSEGARRIGLQVVFAANHDPLCVQYHAANHPSARHECQDLQQLDQRLVPEHDVLWASPACQGHSWAKGKERPGHDVSRATAWAVVSAVEFHRPKLFVVENVREFQRWQLFGCWLTTLHTLGYQMAINELDAADFGIPQHRKRIFIVGHPRRAIRIQAPGRVLVPAATVIDLRQGRWGPISPAARATHGRAPLSPKTYASIEDGRRKHGETFLMLYYSQGQSLFPTRGLDRPAGTVTTRDHHMLIHGDTMRQLTVPELARLMDFPAGYQLPPQRKNAERMLGNAVPPGMAAEVLRQCVEALK